jgi:hypothetical protein
MHNVCKCMTIISLLGIARRDEHPCVMNSNDTQSLEVDLPQPPTPSWYGQLITMASRSLDDMKNEPGKTHELVSAVTDNYSDRSEQDLFGLFWDRLNPTFPPIDFKSVDWLVQASEKAGDSELLTTYALNPAWAGFPKMDRRDTKNCAFFEAYRILLRAATRRPPLNHHLIWQKKDLMMYPDLGEFGRYSLSLLLAGWSGVSSEHSCPNAPPRSESSLFPAGGGWVLFERLLRDYPLSDADRTYCDRRELSVQAAFIAWKEGHWNPQTFRSLLTIGIFDSEAITKIEKSKLEMVDPSCEDFIGTCKEITRKTLDLLLGEKEFDLAASKFPDVEPSMPAIDLILIIGRAMEASEVSADVTKLIRPLTVPPGDTSEAIEKLKQLASKTLLTFTKETSDWIPLILEAIPDRKLGRVIKTVIGTFCSDLLPLEIKGYGRRITYPTLHPGKAASGFTNLQPFFDMLADTPFSVIKKALPVLRQSDSDHWYGLNYISHFLGLPPGRTKKNGWIDSVEWFIELSRRIPLGSADREILLSQRAESISLSYFEACARQTTASFPTGRILRAVMCAHAESSGFASTEAALLDAARLWAMQPELVRDGLTLRKCSNTPEGIILMKGKRAIQNLPPALRKDLEVTRFRAEAFSLWQTRLLFEAEVMPHYYQTGELLEHSGFHLLFGCHSADTLRRRLETSIPSKFEKEFLTAIESKSTASYRFTSIHAFNPAEVLPELIRRGWEHWTGYGYYKGFYSAPIGDGMIGFLFEITPVDPDESSKEGITPPSTPHTLALSHGKGGSAPPDYTSAFHQRVIGIVMRDLVDALPAVT